MLLFCAKQFLVVASVMSAVLSASISLHGEEERKLEVKPILSDGKCNLQYFDYYCVKKLN